MYSLLKVTQASQTKEENLNSLLWDLQFPSFKITSTWNSVILQFLLFSLLILVKIGPYSSKASKDTLFKWIQLNHGICLQECMKAQPHFSSQKYILILNLFWVCKISLLL